MPPVVDARSPSGDPVADEAPGTGAARERADMAFCTDDTSPAPNSGCCWVPSVLFEYVVQETPIGQVPPLGIPFGSPIFTTRIRSARVFTSKLAVVEKFAGPKLVLAPVEPMRK